MAKDKVTLMGDGRYSYSFNNGNTNVFLSKKPDDKIKMNYKWHLKNTSHQEIRKV
jgi:hypothetical protein